MKTKHNRGTDSFGCPSLMLLIGNGTVADACVRPPRHITSTDGRTAWMEGFAAGVKAVAASDDIATPPTES